MCSIEAIFPFSRGELFTKVTGSYRAFFSKYDLTEMADASNFVAFSIERLLITFLIELKEKTVK